MPTRIEREQYEKQAKMMDRMTKFGGILLMNYGFLQVNIMHHYLVAGQPQGEIPDANLAIFALGAAYRFTDGLVSYQTRERPFHFTFSIIERILGLEDKLLTKSRLLKKADED